MIRILLTPISILLNLLPNQAIALLANSMGTLFYYGVGFRKDVLLSNLTIAFGKEKTRQELNGIIKKNYQHYAFVLLEILKSITWNAKRYTQEVTAHGRENIQKFIDEGQGGFILVSHLGNWEYAISAGAAMGIPVDVVVKKSRTPIVENFLQWFRRKTGAGIFLETETAREILHSVSHGRFVCVILDQFMGPPIGLPVKFFGHLAGTAVAPALFTEKKDVPVIPAYNYRDEHGHNHMVFEEAFDFSNLSTDKVERLYQKTQMFNDTMETQIRKHPEQWLWLHRRWKEYNGEPKWILKTCLVSALFILLSGCAAKESATPTGIALPADPTINVPRFETTEIDDGGDEESVYKEEKSVNVNPKLRAAILQEKAKPKETPVAKPKKTKTVQPTKPIAPPEEAFKVVPVDRIPFELGEKLEMELGWTALPAGKAVMEVRTGEVFNGRETFWLWANVLSSKLVDTIYHVDNTVESYVDKQAVMPYKFLLHMVESKQLKETRVSFDHVNKKAHYWAKRISERWGNEEQDRKDDLVPQARDMFSALYYARTLSYRLNQKQSFTIYENGKNWTVELMPVGTELISSGVGAFQCIKILVKVTLNNVFAPTGDIYLWLSDDSKKYPVKFDAKIKIGSLYGLLTKIKER